MKLKFPVFVFIALLLILSFTGCVVINSTETANIADGNAEPSASLAPAGQTPTPVEYTIADYFPFVPNQAMVYRGIGNEFAAYTTYPDYISGNRIQIRTDNGGTETVRVIENHQGKLTEVLSKGEVYYKTNMTGVTKDGEVLLMEPLLVGTRWTLSDGSIREISGLDVPVSTPYGDFTALEVTTTWSNSKTRDYYAPNTGLIKTVFESEGTEISSELEKIIFNSSGVFPYFNIYYPEVTDTDVIIRNEHTEFHLFTNEDITPYFEQAFESRDLMSTNTRIKALYLDEAAGIAYIDFTRAFQTDMNAGAAVESAILQSVVNTVGAYFQVEKVMLTLDGAPYASGHFEMSPDEWFNTDF